MDSSGSPSPDHSWLAFSLSNQYYHHHHPSTSPPPTSTQHQPHHHHNQLSFFQQHPHLYFPPPQPVDEGDGASRGNTNQSNHELSFLRVGDGLLQVGVFPTAEAVTVASIGGGGDGGGVYQHQHHHQQQLQVQVQQADEIQADVNNKQLNVVIANQAHTPSSSKKLVEGFGQRTSIYRGVTRHRWTGRYEAHLWDNSCRREGQSRKGRQVYLGGYDKEEKAARAYDLAALKYWGPTTTTNFPISDYEKELEQMNDMSRQEFVASLRRKSSGFSRGASMYRGVTRHHQHGRWQARIGRVAGNKDLYLGTFSTQEEAAEAYDIAAIKFRGLNAVTNFDISRYDVKSIISSNLPVGGMSNKSKSTPLYNENKPQQVIKPELPLIVPNPNHNSFIGPPIKPASTSQSYPWPALGHQAESNVTPIGYAFGYAPQQQPPPNGNDVNNSASQGYNRYYESSNNNNNNDNNNDNASNNREVGVSGNNSSSTSTSVSNSWIVAPSLHSLQSPKQSVPVLQTPIFGIE